MVGIEVPFVDAESSGYPPFSPVIATGPEQGSAEDTVPAQSVDHPKDLELPVGAVSIADLPLKDADIDICSTDPASILDSAKGPAQASDPETDVKLPV